MKTPTEYEKHMNEFEKKVIEEFRKKFNTDIVKYDEKSPVVIFLLETIRETEGKVETFKSEALDFIMGGYPNPELMKFKIDTVKKTDIRQEK